MIVAILVAENGRVEDSELKRALFGFNRISEEQIEGEQKRKEGTSE